MKWNEWEDNISKKLNQHETMFDVTSFMEGVRAKEKGRKRRFIIWWFLLAGILFSGGALILGHGQQSEISKSSGNKKNNYKIVKEENPENINSTSILNKKFNELKSTSTKNRNNKIIEIQGQSSNRTKSDSSNKVVKTKNKLNSKVPIQVSPPITQSSSNSKTNQSLNLSNDPSIIKNSGILDNSNIALVLPESPNSLSKKDSSLVEIPNLLIKLLSNDFNVELQDANNISNVRKTVKSKWELSPFVSLGIWNWNKFTIPDEKLNIYPTINESALESWQGGINFSKLVKSNWLLGFGLSFAQYNSRYERSVDFKKIDSASPDNKIVNYYTSGLVETIIDSNAMTSYNRRIVNYNQFSLLRISGKLAYLFQLGNKWEIQPGIQAYYQNLIGFNGVSLNTFGELEKWDKNTVKISPFGLSLSFRLSKSLGDKFTIWSEISAYRDVNLKNSLKYPFREEGNASFGISLKL